MSHVKFTESRYTIRPGAPLPHPSPDGLRDHVRRGDAGPCDTDAAPHLWLDGHNCQPPL